MSEMSFVGEYLKPCPDELHCTCVPVLLTTIRDLTAKVEALEKRRAMKCGNCDGTGTFIPYAYAEGCTCANCLGTGAVIVDGENKQEG